MEWRADSATGLPLQRVRADAAYLGCLLHDGEWMNGVMRGQTLGLISFRAFEGW